MSLQKNLVLLGMWPELAKQLATDKQLIYPVVAAGATLTVTLAHLEKVVGFSAASGSTITLPASTGSGYTYRFRVTTTVTSNNHILKVANSTDVMRGVLVISGTTTGLVDYTLAASDTITMNGSTTGGVIGTEIEVTDYASGFWRVSGYVTGGAGTMATTFSASV